MKTMSNLCRILAVIFTLQLTTNSLHAAPITTRYEFNTSNKPLKSNGGLAGDLGSYDLVGGFTLTIDVDEKHASISEVDAILSGVSPSFISLDGEMLAGFFLGTSENIEGNIRDDGSILFEQCRYRRDAIDCFSPYNSDPSSGILVTSPSGDEFYVHLAQSEEARMYPFARKMRLVLELLDDGHEVLLSGSNTYVSPFVLDGGSSWLGNARAVQVPEPSVVLLTLLGLCSSFLRRTIRAAQTA